MRGQLEVSVGGAVRWQGRRYVVTRLVDLASVLAKDLDTGEIQRLTIAQLEPDAEAPAGTAPADVDLAGVPDADWREAERRLRAIRPLLRLERTHQILNDAARAAGVHRATLYRWITAYTASGKLTALLPPKRSGGRGKGRLAPEVEALMKSTIESHYLHKKKPKVEQTCREVERLCRAAGLEPPHPNTVRLRIAALSDETKLAKRSGHRAARDQFRPHRGSFPGADRPLAVAQIDHTLMDLILVDDLDRRPVGRPWLTAVMDVHSRVMLGFYLSFDPPGAMGTGLALAHAVLPKEGWLAERGIDAAWPCWGVPQTVHADNAREFRGRMLERAAQEYGMRVEFRPVATPHYGGHIERLLGTALGEVHRLSGTTFSSPAERGRYDSEKEAVFTLSEFESWLGTWITTVYHQRVHSALETTPIAHYEQGLLGPPGSPRPGIPPRETDPDRLRLDFMPFIERTVQQYGVVIDGIDYYHDVLRRFVHAKDPKNPRLKRTFRFRRDPRDLSALYFFDPEGEHYVRIPYRDTSHPPISVWEFREARRRAREQGHAATDEAAVFAAYDELRRIEEEAETQTKRMRRQATRRRHHAEAPRPATAEPTAAPSAAEGARAEAERTVRPFEDLEEYAPPTRRYP
ncbi:MAG: Mu transposase C-terminal domain-containing protein [Gemmatimonadota bacterium]|nr:Mu transposase C-terminal domain-containing protein [Gemmatimonadota bacterium]